MATQAARLNSAAQSQPRAAAETRSSQQAGSITGRVLSDEGHPLGYAGITISAAPGSGLGRLKTIDTGTDEEGRFRVSGLAPGDYYVRAYAPGYLSTAHLPAEGQESDGPRFRPGDRVTITLKKGGVITGQVTDASHAPAIGAFVTAVLVRDAAGRVIRDDAMAEARTDDRGIYRLYGLPPGSYLIRVSGCRGYDQCTPAYLNDAPTYHPSAKREGAAEIPLRPGEEMSGIDLRYRGERGRLISGTLTTDASSEAALDDTRVALIHAATGAMAGYAYGGGAGRIQSFVLEGVPDGEYEISAWGLLTHAGRRAGVAAPPRRITVNGTDVTGVELRLATLGSLAGRIILATAQAAGRPTGCETICHALVEEVDLRLRREGAGRQSDDLSASENACEAIPNDQGEFAFHNLEAGRYRVMAQLPCEHWYIRAITAAAPGSPTQLNDAGRQGLLLRADEHLTGLTITVAEGAASVRGRVVPAAAGMRLPARLRVHLIPAEQATADDVLRYAQTTVRSDGGFDFGHLAPGRYWLLQRPLTDDESPESADRPAAWDHAERAKLRREAEAAKITIELRPCQRVNEFPLPYSTPATNK
jgi:hypothetical protein